MVQGPMCDIVWSDPDERTGWGISPRGAGYTLIAENPSFSNLLFCLSYSITGLISELQHQLPVDESTWGQDLSEQFNHTNGLRQYLV